MTDASTSQDAAMARRVAQRVLAKEDPVSRAIRRMEDAYDRGGFRKMLRSTEIRIERTKDASKLRGIWAAIEHVVRVGLFVTKEPTTAVKLTASQKQQLQALAGGDEFKARGRTPKPEADPRHKEWAKGILNVAESLIEDARREEDVSLRRTNRADARDLKRVVKMIEQGKIDKAKSTISGLDTMVREYIPQSIWDGLGMDY